mgnify:FL=1
MGVSICSGEVVEFSGTIHFSIKEENGVESAHVHYSNVHGVGIQSGTKYVVHEHDEYDVNLNANGDTMFSTTMHGSFISGGPGDNTKVEIRFVNVVHPDGTVTVLEEGTEITCPG